ncbi:MAG: hypothetical protein SNJ72_02675 [Fimbriimonadales bacterium]
MDSITPKHTVREQLAFEEMNQGNHASLACRRQPILFRNSVPEIRSTTAGTFGIYKYPAKFIPQVIAYVLRCYAQPGMRIFDPFAGYGTVGVVSRVYGYDYELWDLNPLMKVIHDTATLEAPIPDPAKLVQSVRASEAHFLPEWSNIGYWHPEPFLELLSRAWGFVHQLEGKERFLLLIPMINVTRYFSYADEKVHKLYKSKHSKAKVASLLEDNWQSLFWAMLEREVYKLAGKLSEYHQMKPAGVHGTVRAGIDTLHAQLDQPVDIMVTSPPYLQAQEYIRSTKLELFWLGHSEATVRWLSKHEIPYRNPEPITIYSELYHRHHAMIEEPHLLTLYENYFRSILNIFARLSEQVRQYLCIFVGPAKIRTVPIPIDDIIAEHLSHFGWQHEVTYIDQIVSRVMFNAKLNPASGLQESRMRTEHMVVLKRMGGA